MKVLIFEPNSFHYEVLPGFAWYFLKLGYEVYCLTQENKSYGDVFCRCPELKAKIHFLYYEKDTALEMLRSLQRHNKFDLLFFNSIDLLNDMCRQAVIQITPMFHQGQAVAGCAHALFRKDEEYREILQYFKDRIVTLSNTNARGSQDGELFEVNPNYFCDTTPKRALHDQVSVISVGVNQNRNELVRAANQLYKKTGETPKLVFIRKQEKLLDELIHLAKFAVIKLFPLPMLDSSLHRPSGKIDQNVKSKTEITGRISFEEMFARIEAADFIVLNFYQGFKKNFSTCQTSGSKQLSLGFLIPCIIEKKTAEYYGFSEKNALVYEDGQLAQALERASSMSREEYAQMVRELEKLQREIRERSLQNLSKLLENT